MHRDNGKENENNYSVGLCAVVGVWVEEFGFGV